MNKRERAQMMLSSQSEIFPINENGDPGMMIAARINFGLDEVPPPCIGLLIGTAPTHVLEANPELAARFNNLMTDIAEALASMDEGTVLADRKIIDPETGEERVI